MMALQLIAGILIPLGLMLYFYKKRKLKLSTFFIGCGTWFVAVVVLEGIVHSLILYASPWGDRILENTLLYALYGGLMAGVFEETARFVVFKTLLRKQQGRDETALMYGAGHGGFECFYIMVIGAVNLLFYSFAINSGEMLESAAGVDSEIMAQVEEAINQLATVSPASYLFGIQERISAVILHMALSVLVWFAAKERVKKIGLLFLAIALHFAVDAISVLLSSVLSLFLVELVILAMALGTAFIAYKVWKKYSRPELEPEAFEAGPRIGDMYP